MPEGRQPRSVSVIIPVLNAEDHIDDALAGLARQDYSGEWEVVVADNGCSDRTVEIVESWRGELPELRVVEASARRGPAHARNVAADAARGEFIACCDADNLPSPGWLRSLAEAAVHADLVGAQAEWDMLNSELPDGWPPLREWRTRTGSRFRRIGGSSLGAWAGIVRRLRWDESMRSGEDADLSWRAHLAGMTVVRAPEAVIHKRYRRRLPSLARQAFRYGYPIATLRARYGSSGPTNSTDSRTQWARLLRDLRSAQRSRAARARLVWHLSFAAGRLVGWRRARGPAGENPAGQETEERATA
jgi:glycosyltransferase involved in cell wall biosynthesis